jgi:hypothetical protein
MSLRKGLHISLAALPLVVGVLAHPTASRAAEPKKHVKCEITTDGKTETKMVASADECTKLGGKVVPPKHKGA